MTLMYSAVWCNFVLHSCQIGWREKHLGYLLKSSVFRSNLSCDWTRSDDGRHGLDARSPRSLTAPRLRTAVIRATDWLNTTSNDSVERLKRLGRYTC